MALQALALLVVGQRDAAIFALHRAAATAAQHEPGVAAAVDEDERLRALREALGDGVVERCGKWRRRDAWCAENLRACRRFRRWPGSGWRRVRRA